MSMRYPGGLIASTPVTAAYPSGVWTQAQAIPYQSQNVWTRDQYWPYTTLLLQGDGAVNGAQNNTFLDSSTNNFTITRNGNTTQGSFTPYEQDGYWSNFFGGSSDYLTLANNAAFDLGTGDCTIEAWIFTNSLSATQAIFSAFPGSGTISGYTFLVGTSGTISVDSWVSGTNQGAAASNYPVSVGSWFHVAYTRSGGTNRIFVNGNLCALSTNTLTQALNTGGNTPKIGYQGYSGFLYPFNGYISNLRIVKGTAVYTAAFTPSTAPLTAITNTSLLTCQSNRFRDNSTNAFAITVNGSPSVQAFQPFPGATTWSASVLGGSGYFDAGGDYLSTNYTINWSTYGSYTLEFWIYHTTMSPTNQWYFVGGTGGTGNTVFYNYANGRVGVGIIGTNEITSASGVIKANTWQHVAYTYNGTTTKIYVDGVEVASGTTAIYANSSVALSVGGGSASASDAMNGYMANLRLSQSVIYTTAFTPPTSPVTGGALLMNFTNAGIFDAAVMNDLETVGNAQVSTSVVKYGTGSMYFDGTDDRLTAPASPNLAFNTGDFTVEGWIYTGSTGNLGVFQISGTAGGLQANQTNNTAVYCNNLMLGAYYGGTYKSGTTPIVANTWTHFALVRSSSVTRLYVNGVLDSGFGSNSDTQNYTGQNICVGGYFGTSNLFNGYIDDFRITKGAARYITNFTPPPARMPGQ